MRYGHFDDEGREYVITRPDTPLPWINYLGSEAYFGIISNTAGGYSFYRDARLRRLTRYRYNNAPLDLGGRYVYLRDDESGEYWSPSWQPTQRELEDYSCRHGLGYSIIGSRIRRDPGRDALLRPARREPGGLADSRHQRAAGRGQSVALQLDRVVPLGRQRRRHQLPAQLLDRPGRGRGRRHLPQDRVPGAARPLRLLRLLRAAGRLRHPARRVPGPLPRLGPPDRRRAGQGHRLGRPRLAADGLAPRQARACARRDARGHLPARLPGEREGRQVRPARQPDDQQAAGQAGHRPLPPGRRGRRRRSRTCATTGPVCSASCRSRPATSTSIGWSTSGTPTSAW